RPRLEDAQDHLGAIDHLHAERRAQVATLPRRELVVGDDEEIRAQALEVGLRPARKLAGSAREPGEFLELSFSNVRDAGGLDSALHDPVGDTDTEAPQEVFELREGAADVRILHLGELDGHENRAEFSRGRVAKRRHVDLRNQKRWRSRIAWLDRLGWRGRVVLAVRAPATFRTKTQKALGTPRPPLAVGGVSSQRKRTEYMTAGI